MTENPKRGAAPGPDPDAEAFSRRFKPSLLAKAAYATRIVPRLGWHRISRHIPAGPVHLIFALADHFEPAIIPTDGRDRAPADEQERRMESWCREYPRLANEWRDSDGHSFQHTYFYPAEQYQKELVDRLAEHCREGWGEAAIHLHHGVDAPDTTDSTRRTLTAFRDSLEQRGCLSYLDGTGAAR